MSRTPVRVFPSADTIGEELAPRLLERIELARLAGKRFVLGCPTGRTPRPVYGAMARQLARAPQDISHLVLVLMDEYLARAGGGFEYASADEPWSTHYFVHVEIAGRLNEKLPRKQQLRDDSIWFPDPCDPAAYDAKIADVGGIDFFILASGASDGHVAFNPPGSRRDTRTRIIELSAETRRDNVQTFPAFGSPDAVPTHGISVGIDTIASAKESVMILSGAGKHLTLTRILRAERYEPNWPATVIHECVVREILADTDAVAGSVPVD